MDSIRISWSALRNWKDCKQRAKLVRTGKRHKLENERNFLPGNITDRVVRDFLKSGEFDKGTMADMVDDYLKKQVGEAKNIKWKGTKAADLAEIKKDCIQAVNVMEPYLLKYVTPYEQYADYKFNAPMHAARNGGGDPIHVTLNGFMDILVRDDKGRWFVFDVKHTKDKDYYKKTGGQMVFYSTAVELIHGTAPTAAALLQPLVEKKPVQPIPTGEAARKELFLDITRMANDIYFDEMPPRADNTLCGWCNVQHACVKFQGEIDERGRRRVPLGRPTLDLLG